MSSRNAPTPLAAAAGSLAAGPQRIRWTIDQAASRDGHQLLARFSATASIVASAADAAMLRETFHHEPSAITADLVRAQFLAAVEPAAMNYLNRHDAAKFDDSRETNLACEAIANALRAAGFAAGVRFMAPFALTIESPTRQRAALETAARAREAEAMAHATRVMQQFKRLRDEQPASSVEQVLTQVGPASESLVPTLLREWAERRATSSIMVTSGEQLLQFTPSGSSWTPQPMTLPQPIGALRCVLALPVRGEIARERVSGSPTNGITNPQASFLRAQGEPGRTLVLGGQSGAMVLNTGQLYRLPTNRPSQLGINAVACGASHLFATHSEFGLLVWPIEEPNHARLDAFPGARLATLVDADRCVFATGDGLFVSDGNAAQRITAPTSAAIVSILAMANEARVIFADGTVARFDSRAARFEIHSRLGGSIALATTIDWLGEPRLLIANDRGEIECVGGSSRTRFVSGHGGWRKIVAAADLIAALSLDRTRLVLWRPWEPQQPIAELHVASVTQHRVSDLALT